MSPKELFYLPQKLFAKSKSVICMNNIPLGNCQSFHYSGVYHNEKFDNFPYEFLSFIMKFFGSIRRNESFENRSFWSQCKFF